MTDTTVVSADWDFDDPGSETVNSLNPAYTFSSAGDHYVRCTLHYANGESKTYGSNVRIRGPLDSIVNDTTLCSGDTFRFQSCDPETLYGFSESVENEYHEITVNDTIVYETSNGCYQGRQGIAVHFQQNHTVDLGPDTLICFDDLPYPLELPLLPEATYYWSNGDTIAQTYLSEAGNHYAAVTLGPCSVRDSMYLGVTPAMPVADLGTDTSLCTGDTLVLDVSQEGAEYHWHDGSTEPSYSVVSPEQIRVDILLGGCQIADSLTVAFYDAPEVNLGLDTTLCQGDTLWLNVYSPEAAYLWQDSSEAPEYAAFDEGLHHVQVNKGYCTRSDSIFLSIIEPPFQPEQKQFFICEGEFQEVDLAQEGVSLQWSDGSTHPTFTTEQPEVFHVFRENLCGSANDTFEVFLEFFPELEITGVQEGCLGDTVLLKVAGDFDFIWDNGSADSIRTVVHSGEYFVEASNRCGSLRESHRVQLEECCEADDIPNLITPNGDQRNDYFYFECAQYGGWEINIYNRHGKRVFSDRDYKNNWDGKGLSDGVYYYQLKKGNTYHKGWIHLLR
ncbi:gliding motility-associated C-terminal domain-containing protein [Cytophagaceae bacterium ABcell3]|nr:gliding motility-associated C-terminal domain-containing protein [Cytophagaceae bacterium ABcell3]